MIVRKIKTANISTCSLFIISIFFIWGCKNIEKNNTTKQEELPYYNEATFTPRWFSKDHPALDTFHTISPFSLINQDGQIVSNETCKGKIYITDFFFTVCPGICPRMTKNMGELQDFYLKQEEIIFLSHSVTPERDSVPVLKEYAEEKGILSGKWHLLTGDRDEIYKLGRQAYFVEEDLGLERDIDEFLHTENFVLIDQNGHIRGIYNGLNKASLENLKEDISTLLSNS